MNSVKIINFSVCIAETTQTRMKHFILFPLIVSFFAHYTKTRLKDTNDSSAKSEKYGKYNATEGYYFLFYKHSLSLINLTNSDN